MSGDLTRLYAGEETCSRGVGALIPLPVVEEAAY